MTTESTITNEDEISLLDIWNLLLRQQKTIISILIVIMTFTLAFVLSRPTIYQSKTSIMIGEQLYFSQVQTLAQSQPQPATQQIETAEEIQYRYSPFATIAPIKKTRIIEIITSANKPETAEENLKSTVQKIIANHQAILNDKKSKFDNLLNLITNNSNINKSELIRLLDNASTSSLTKQLTNIETTELKYSGIFIKTVGIGIFTALFISLFFAILKDYIERNRS